MTYNIGGEFVRGDDKVIRTTLRQADLDGVGSYRSSEPIQRVAIKGLFQDRLEPVGGRHGRWRTWCAGGLVPGRLRHARPVTLGHPASPAHRVSGWGHYPKHCPSFDRLRAERASAG
jgi:hypothetical protein